MGTASPNQSADLAWLLKNLTLEVPGIRGCVLLSSDGMVKAAHGLERTDSEYLAAVASGFLSMARTAAATFDGGNTVRQVVAELHTSQLFIAWAGFNSVLAVLAGGDADPAVVGYEMSRLIKAVRPFLGTAVRAPADAPGDGSQ